MYEPAAKNPPQAVIRMCDAIYQADGLMWSSPIYNGTISASFKNALDWLMLLGGDQPGEHIFQLPLRDLEATLDQEVRELKRVADPIPQAIIVMNPDEKPFTDTHGSCTHTAVSW